MSISFDNTTIHQLPCEKNNYLIFTIEAHLMKHLYSLTIKTFLAIAVSTFCFSAHAEVDAAAAKALAKDNHCFTCHAVDKEKTAIAWNKVAAKYKGDPQAQAKLIEHLSAGKNVKFADGHEEAHMILKSDDAAATKNLVDWILSL
jgi:cytochrome c